MDTPVAEYIKIAVSVADEAAGLRVLGEWVHSRYGVMFRQCGELRPHGYEERIGTDNKRIRALTG
jgi:hypothetical protein